MKSIYAITPPNEKLENLLQKVESLLEAGITLFQYRSKAPTIPIFFSPIFYLYLACLRAAL